MVLSLSESMITFSAAASVPGICVPRPKLREHGHSDSQSTVSSSPFLTPGNVKVSSCDAMKSRTGFFHSALE